MTPIRFVAEGDWQEVVDSPFEQSYQLGDVYSASLLVALCRQMELSPYRRRRQRQTTVCVHASRRVHEALWSRFMELSRHLDDKLARATEAFVHEAVHSR